MAMFSEPPVTIPCRFCGRPTPMLGTKLCDGCWEIDMRIRVTDDDVFEKIAEANGWRVHKNYLSMNNRRREKMNNAKARNLARTAGIYVLKGVRFVSLKLSRGLIWVGGKCTTGITTLIGNTEEV